MLPVERFNVYIKENVLLSAGDSVLLAVSGGKDSVLMVHLFKAAGYQFGIAHCNFNLRGDESQRDEAFVKMLAATLDVPFYVAHFETKKYASVKKISTQMAARQLRYDWFETVRAEHKYSAIALAQHSDDAIETILLNLTRGTGIAGLHGILPKRGWLIRPLMFLSRQEIDNLIQNHQINYVEDSSNASTNYARNKIRHQVVPTLTEINPNLQHTFAQNIRRFSETEAVLINVVNNIRNTLFEFKDETIYISFESILRLHPKHLLTYELLKPFDFSESVITDLFSTSTHQSGTTFYSQTHRLLVNRGQLMISAIEELNNDMVFVHHSDIDAVFGNLLITVTYSYQKDLDFEATKAYVDEAKLIFPLVIRSWEDGDKFKPFGMKGFKKLSDFLINQKVPLSKKSGIPLLINGNGEIIWVGGLRQDDRYKITTTTKKVAIFEVYKLSS